MKVIYDLIHAKVKPHLEGIEVNRHNYDTVVVPLWFKCAEEVYDEMEAQGLVETARHVREIIEEDRKTYGYASNPDDEIRT